MRILHVLILGLFLSSALAQQTPLPDWMERWQGICQLSVLATARDLGGITLEQAERKAQTQTEYVTTSRRWYTTTFTTASTVISAKTAIDSLFRMAYALHPALKKLTVVPLAERLVETPNFRGNYWKTSHIAPMQDSYIEFYAFRTEQMHQGRLVRLAGFGCHFATV
jgi:hypothetical protein